MDFAHGQLYSCGSPDMECPPKELHIIPKGDLPHFGQDCFIGLVFFIFMSKYDH